MFNHHLELKGTVKFSMANNENVEIPSSEKVIENAHFNNGKITLFNSTASGIRTFNRYTYHE